MKSNKAGHLAAVFTIIIWGTTFISTKVLLTDFKPVEILFYRFLTGFLALSVYPKRLKGVTPRQEFTFAAAGLCGVCLYYLLENVALTYTLASDTGVIISSAPLFTVIFSRIFNQDGEKPRARFFVGFAAAMVGIGLIGFGGSGVQESGELSGRLVGDILALLAAAMWGIYSLLTKKIGGFGYPTIPATRRIFFYGILFMIPALFIFKFEFKPLLFTEPLYLLNMLFLGLFASALCFVSWGFSVGKLGAVAASLYIYAVPVVTLIASALILKEEITLCAIAGTALTIAGLFISGGKAPQKSDRRAD